LSHKHNTPSLFTRLRKSKWFSWVRDISLFALVFFAITTWQAKDMLSSDGSVTVAQQNLVTLTGEVSPMLDTEKTNLVYFFAPWCQICALSIDNLSYVDPDSVNVVVIALDYSSKEEVDDFVAKHGVTNTVFLGSNVLKQNFKIQGYPSYYLVDKNSTVTSSSYGYSTAVGLKLREAFGK
jgi:thiol-disulfide isomerase/thioredoxin